MVRWGSVGWATAGGAAAAMLLLLAGCDDKPLQTPAGQVDWNAPPPYMLHPGDEVEVKFYYSPQMDEREFIAPDGTITLPLLDQDEVAAGRTVDQLHDDLVNKYAAQLRNPKIEVVLRTAASDRVFVAGEVNQQGAVVLDGPTTVAKAVILAQGMKHTAWKSQVLVIRPVPGGGVVTRVVDYNAIMRGRQTAQDLTLAAGDIVYVPETRIARVDEFVADYIRNALPTETSFGLSYLLAQQTTAVVR